MARIHVQNYKNYLMSLKYTPDTKHIVFDLFIVTTMQHWLYYSGGKSKNNLQLMILTYLWPWNKVKVIKLVRIARPRARFNQAKFERLPLNNVPQKANIKYFCQIRKRINYLPWLYAEVKKRVAYLLSTSLA